jgi:hypothetical protein
LKILNIITTNSLLVWKFIGSMICPVQLLSDYLVLRGNRPGFIFISHLGNPLLLNFRGLSGIVVWTLQNTNLIHLELAPLPMQLRTDILMRKFVR